MKAGKVDVEIWEDNSQGVPERLDTPLKHIGVKHIALSVSKLEPVLGKMKQHGYPVIKDIYEVTRCIRETIVLGPDNLEIQFVEQNIPVLIWRSISGDLKAMSPKK